MFVNTTVKTLDMGEEKGEVGVGSADQHNDDNDRGEEEGGYHNDAWRRMILMSVVDGVTDSRSCSHMNSSGELPQSSLLPSLCLALYLQ